ncbi:MAG: tRNA (adenosine(37)-N6)-dimethylallyltransferase MiaA [Candidatus Omnitrophota bacterium]
MQSHRASRQLIFIVGPTAIGKTEASAALAKKINAEIISCDSMQVYKGMDILTSKSALSLRKKIPHHLLSIISPEKEYNVSKYRKEALKKIKILHGKGKIPLFAGGTGLYMSILIDGLFKPAPENKRFRKKLYEEAQIRGSSFLYRKLKKVDSAAAAKIHPNDAKRIIRALEVYQATGKPISELQKERKGLSRDFDIKIFCLNMDREALRKRIDIRVERMFRQGLAKEARRLLRMKLSRTARCAIGLRELKGYFAGLYDLAEAKRLIKRNTYLYAKRQLTWFRKDKRISWVNITGKEKPAQIARRIWRELY